MESRVSIHLNVTGDVQRYFIDSSYPTIIRKLPSAFFPKMIIYSLVCITCILPQCSRFVMSYYLFFFMGLVSVHFFTWVDNNILDVFLSKTKLKDIFLLESVAIYSLLPLYSRHIVLHFRCITFAPMMGCCISDVELNQPPLQRINEVSKQFPSIFVCIHGAPEGWNGPPCPNWYKFLWNIILDK